MGFKLHYAGREVILGVGEVIIGRHTDCNITLHGASVSRRHARLIVSDDHIEVEDCGSANGVFVNGRRIEGTVRLEGGDHLAIANHSLELRAGGASGDPGVTSPKLRAPLPTLPDDERSLSTRATSALALLSQVASKMLALGKVADAERVLGGNLVNTLELAKQEGAVDADAALDSAREALKLADATSRARWVEYVFELFTVRGEPMPAEIIDELHAVLRKVPRIDLALLRGYLRALEADPGRLAPRDRFLVQRIRGLEQVAAAR